MTAPDFSRARWVKSNLSGDTGCVEVAYADGVIGVRDSKQDGAGPILVFNAREWEAFIAAARNVEFALDRLG